jgi:hypothetical protein
MISSSKYIYKHKQLHLSANNKPRRSTTTPNTIRRLLRCLAELVFFCVLGMRNSQIHRTIWHNYPQRFGPRQELAHWEEQRSGA